MSPTNIKMEDIVKAAKKFKSVVIFPHPYSAMYTGIFNHHFHKDRIGRLLSMSHGVEVINSENIHKWNLRSTVLGFNLNKAIIGGSDGHTLYHMGKVVTYSDCKKTRKDFLDAIKSNMTKVIGKEIDLLRKVTSNSIKLRMTLKNYPDIVEKNLKYSYTALDSKTKKLRKNVEKIISRDKKDKRIISKKKK